MTDDEREKVAHALGLPRHPWRQGARARRWAYRNYFAAGDDDVTVWRGLVERGLATTLRPRDPERCSYPGFAVTPAGVEAAGLRRYVPTEVVPRMEGKP